MELDGEIASPSIVAEGEREQDMGMIQRYIGGGALSLCQVSWAD